MNNMRERAIAFAVPMPDGADVIAMLVTFAERAVARERKRCAIIADNAETAAQCLADITDGVEYD